MEAPRLITVSMIIDDGKVLLVKRAREPYKDCWSFVGGISIMSPKYSSDPLQAAKDEVEADLKCDFDPTFFTYGFDEEDCPTVTLYFYGKITGTPEVNQKYVSECKWFTFEEAKQLKLAFAHNTILDKLIDKK